MGDWTMIYDEGFEVHLKGVKYMAFSKYVSDGSYDYKSECSKTLVGWYFDTNT
jgi:cathepsin C